MKGTSEMTFGQMCYRCFGRAILALLFCVLMFSSFIADFTADWAKSLLSFIFFCVLYGVHYGGIWSMGEDDGTHYRVQHTKKKLWLGLAASAVTAVPFAAVNLWLAYQCYSTEKNLIWVFNLINSPVFFINKYLDLKVLSDGLIASAVLRAAPASCQTGTWLCRKNREHPSAKQ